MEKKETLHSQILDRQLGIESDLKKEVEAAQAKLSSARLGFKAESEMYQESVEKLSSQERIIAELEAKVGDLERENTELSASVKRRESVSSGEFSPSHTKEASVLSDTSFEVRPAASTGATSSSSGVSSDDSDTEASNSDCGQVRAWVYIFLDKIYLNFTIVGSC